MKRVAVAVFAFTLMAAIAIADNHHGGPGGPGPGAGFRDGGDNPIVASDGTIFITSVTEPSANTYVQQVKAIRSTGTVAWTVTLDSGTGHLVLSDGNLIGVTDTSTTSGSTTTYSAKLTARSTATGAIAWTLSVDGRVTSVEPFSGGTYVIAAKPPATSGGAATHSLIAVSNSGSVLWTVSLD